MKSSGTLTTEVSVSKRSVLSYLFRAEGLVRGNRANLRGYCQGLSE